MHIGWKSQTTRTEGLTRYKTTEGPKAKGYIQRYPDGTAHAQIKTGFMGLGASSTIDFRAPAPADQAILHKFENFIAPPRFENWKEVESKKADEGVSVYKDAKGAVAEIAHKDGAAEVKVRSGLFGLGLSIDGSYFAPAPSDQKILENLSQA